VVHTSPSHLEGQYTRANINNVAARRNSMQFSTSVYNRTTQVRNVYRSTFTQYNTYITNVYRNYYTNDAYRSYYGQWFSHGYYGGYFYPVRYCANIDLYFEFPIIRWIFTPQDSVADNDFYQTWYGSDLNQYPVEPFNFAGIFYPTDTLRDLGYEIGALSAEAQSNFRTDLNFLGDRLTWIISEDQGQDFVPAADSMVINYYQNLQNQAIVVAGFVDQGDVHLPFEAIFDLVDVQQTTVFAPTESAPTPDDLATLQEINQRIEALGGDPLTADIEPTTFAAPQ